MQEKTDNDAPVGMTPEQASKMFDAWTEAGERRLIGNIVWFLLAGLWLAIGHVMCALACFLTIIGIPFGIQHLKLGGLALAPIGKTVVMKEVAAAARRANADTVVAGLRGARAGYR